MIRSTLAVLLITSTAAATADGFDYNHLQLDYGNVEFDDVSVDGDGFGISGSFAINPEWHVFGGYQNIELDFGIDARTLGAGVGYNTELSSNFDVIARASYQYVEFDAPQGSSVDDNGLGFGVGLRYAASRELELTAGIDYVDLSDSGNDTSISGGALYNFDNAFSVGLAASFGDDTTSYNLSGRYYFGT